MSELLNIWTWIIVPKVNPHKHKCKQPYFTPVFPDQGTSRSKSSNTYRNSDRQRKGRNFNSYLKGLDDLAKIFLILKDQNRALSLFKK